MRTTEFLWQEGHTVHETHEDALKMVHQALDWYIDLYHNWFAIDGVSGIKSSAEKFAGAQTTTTYEMLIPDGKVLQGCTSHDLSQNFAKVFNMKFLGKSGQQEIPWQTSWGLSTRSIGALVLVHGDDRGLILPPKLAPTQAVIITIFNKDTNPQALIDKATKLQAQLKDFRVEVDNRQDQSAGWKFNEWELKGVPLRMELGLRELNSDTIVLVRRDNNERITVKTSDLRKIVCKLLTQIQHSLFLKSRGFIKAFWCEDPECEARIKTETKASTRCLPLDAKAQKGKCVYCGKAAIHEWFFAQAY